MQQFVALLELDEHDRWFQQDGATSHTLLTLQCGMTSAVRHSENIPCSGVTSAARHGARSHSFVYISTTSGANVIGLLRACS